MIRLNALKNPNMFKPDMILRFVWYPKFIVTFIIIIEMSMLGTYASQSFTSTLGQKTTNKQEISLFNKIDAVTA